MLKQPSVPWVPSNDDVVKAIVSLLRPKPTDIFYDIGCGDGRVALAVAERHRIRSVCIELRPDLVRKAREAVHSKHLESLVTVIEGDFYEEPLTNATIVYMYLLTSVNQKLRPKLERELANGTIILSLDFPIPGWRVAGLVELPRAWQKTIYVYVKGFSDLGKREIIVKALERLNKKLLTHPILR